MCIRDSVNDAPLTRMYISEEETLYDAGQLYNKLRSTVVALSLIHI